MKRTIFKKSNRLWETKREKWHIWSKNVFKWKHHEYVGSWLWRIWKFNSGKGIRAPNGSGICVPNGGVLPAMIPIAAKVVAPLVVKIF